MYKFQKRDFVYIIIIILYYLLNVEVFNYTFEDCIMIETPPANMRYSKTNGEIEWMDL
jgi:hypothetical protein